MEVSLEGKVALVTGVGPNIGSGVALALARYGAKVACNDVDENAIKACIARVERNGGAAIAAPGDVTDEAAVQGYINTVLEHWGHIDILVNNAALLGGRGVLDETAEAFERAMRVSALGTFLNTQSTLTAREIELGICLIARHWKTEYLFRAHGARAIKAGLPPTVIAALRDNKTPELPDPREQAIYEIATLAEQPSAGPDETFDKAVDILGRDGLAEVISLLGYYSAVAIAMKLHRVPLPPAV